MNPIDPNQIAAAAISELIKSMVKGATAQGLQLLGEIRERFSKDERAKRSLDNLQADPSDPDYANYFGKHLRRLLEDDPDFRARLASLLPAPTEQTISASRQSVIEDAEQASDSDNVTQRIEASDESEIRNVRQRRTTH